MWEKPEDSTKYVDVGDLISTKPRKFFFSYQNKQVERDFRVTISVSSDDRGEEKIIIELTSDNNPVFLFTLFITKHDFDVLQSEQGINVDFNDFPTALVDLLDKCISNEGKGLFKLVLEDYGGSIIGQCAMDLKKIQIKIIEECAFKNVCHLSLFLMRATEAQIRQKLEKENYKVIQKLARESKLHEETLKKNSELLKDIADRNTEIENLIANTNLIKKQHQQEIINLNEQVGLQAKQFCKESEEQMDREKEKFNKESNKVKMKLQKIEEELQLFKEKHQEVQCLLHEKEKEKELCEAELTSANQDILQLKNQNAKLDSDYHDKDKTVHILRTRLAVAEQELKDNNILLLSHQAKLSEASKERNDVQRNLDFIKEKLERKEITVINLSEELLKANEIISKHQGKVNILLTNLSDAEENVQKRDKLIEEKEWTVYKQAERSKELQEELDTLAKQVCIQNERISNLENDIKKKDEKLKSTSKVLVMLKESIKGSNFNFTPTLAEQSLLSYRAFLSTPSLLPSDDNRRVEGLCESVKKNKFSKSYCIEDMYLPEGIESETTSVSSDFIDAYISRYVKRFELIPMSLFKSANMPNVVLSSPVLPLDRSVFHKGLPHSKSYRSASVTYQNQEKISTTEYAAFTRPFSRPAKLVSSDSLLTISNYRNKNVNPSATSIACKTDDSSETNTTSRVVHFDKSSNNSNEIINCISLPEAVLKTTGPPMYDAPYGMYRMTRDGDINYLYPAADNPTNINYQETRMEGKDCLVPKITSVRKMPAVPAPPLTAEQRENIETGLNKRRQFYQLPFKKEECEIGFKTNLPSYKLSKDHILQPNLQKSKMTVLSTASSGLQSSNTASKSTLKENEPSAYFMS